jgi:uncharacterized repeat protein (TIGR01451 family)
MKTRMKFNQQALRRWALTFCFAMLLAAVSFAQTITSVNPTTTTAGQSISMIVTGTNTNFTAVTGMYLRHSTQTGTVYIGTNYQANSATNASIDFTIPPNAPLGNYNLSNWTNPTFTNALNVAPGPGSNYGLVSGKVILDNNSNCVEDGGDIAVAGAIISIQPGPHYATTGTQGDFSAWVPLGNYTLATNVSACGTWVCPSTGGLTANLPTSLSTDIGKDFYWHPTSPCADLQSFVYTQNMRPGFDVNCQVSFRNDGPDAVSNAVGTMTLDAGVTYVSANVAPSSVNGSVLTWNFASMASGSTQMITVVVHVPSTMALGTNLHFSSTITAVGTDPQLANNNSMITKIVTSAVDPNDKQVWDLNGHIADGGIDPTTATLNYLIRFQNTGNDTAFNIYVRDTLDSDLDPGTLRVTASSHPYQLSMTGAGNVQFTFPNILLVDSFANEPLSHGFIGYTIDLNPGLPLGTTISNRASIYFDFNQPVLTNRTNSVLCVPLNENFSFVQNGLSYTFTDLSDASANAWAWDFGDGSTSTAQNPSHTYAAPGNYTVCLHVSSSCRTEIVCQTIVLVGNTNALNLHGLRAYPNPSMGVFRIEADLLQGGTYQVQVLDGKGRMIQAFTQETTATALSASVDLSDKAAGLYMVRIVHGGQSATLKLVKE